MEITYRGVTLSDLNTLAQLEASSYPSDEAASADALAFRIKNAHPYFLVMIYQGNIIGYICSTLTGTQELTHESMAQHEPSGKYLCIHSVVIAKSFQRKGLGLMLVREYLDSVTTMCNVDEVLLIAKANLIEFYTKAGFSTIRLSPIVHGKDPWFEMQWKNHHQSSLVLQGNAFTTHYHGGNAAAVVVMFKKHSGEWMAQMAKELNQPTTAFVLMEKDQDIQIRWYNAMGHVPLCGHATLVATAALYHAGFVKAQKNIIYSLEHDQKLISFIDRQDNARCTNVVSSISLTFPVEHTIPVELPKSYLEILFQQFSLESHQIIAIEKNRLDALVHVTTEAFSLLDTSKLSTLERLPDDCRGMIITTETKGLNVPFDFYSRYFHKCGVEDAVCGSAHCGLAPYWSKRLSKSMMNAYQKSERGGTLKLTMKDDEVTLAGSVCLTYQGKLL